MRLSAFASVKLTIALMSVIIIAILLGSWCPQEYQVGYQKVIETFGPDMAVLLRNWGVTDLFHSPFFLALIALITLNMIACSVQRVFPRARLLKQRIQFLSEREISKFPLSVRAGLACPAEHALAACAAELKKQGYAVEIKDNKITGEWAKAAILASTVTHIGLLLLLLGVTITSWTGFGGFKPVRLGETLGFIDSEHSKLWFGKLPAWKLRVDDTRREDYENGDPKQWYSKLSLLDEKGRVLKQGEISVNNPFSFEGVDVYQSSWGLASLRVSFNGRAVDLPLRQMGNANAAFMPLDGESVMIFSLRGQNMPLRVFAKMPEWQEPRLLAEIAPGKETRFGEVKVGYIKAIPLTGLQYKSDPGLPVTYAAFTIITLGVMMAAVPHRQVWACVSPAGSESCFLQIGGVSKKAKTAFLKSLDRLNGRLKTKFGEFIQQNTELSTKLSDNEMHISAGAAG